jgi:hypothetical protein
MLRARRNLLIGLGSMLAAPAIVRASSLMPVKRPPLAAVRRVLILDAVPAIPSDTQVFSMSVAHGFRMGDLLEINGEMWRVTDTRPDLFIADRQSPSAPPA